jgi:hypothetical protein
VLWLWQLANITNNIAPANWREEAIFIFTSSAAKLARKEPSFSWRVA